jgi:ABC-type polysaccharide/polyol phosphate export permease
MGNYLAAIWRCRYFWLSLVRNDLRTRYRRSMLGLGWSLLHPLAMTVILCTVFHTLFHRDVKEYGPYLLAGLACWNFILAVSVQGCQCLLQGESYIRQYPAPMAIYPLRTTLGAMIHFLIALALVLVLDAVLNGGFSHLPSLLSLIPTLGLLLVLGWCGAVVMGFTNVYFQDTQHLTEVGFQILFYATPIIYPADLLKEKHMNWMLTYNPIVKFIKLVRMPILEDKVPSLETFAAAGGTVLAAAIVAVLTLALLQRKVIFQM